MAASIYYKLPDKKFYKFAEGTTPDQAISIWKKATGTGTITPSGPGLLSTIGTDTLNAVKGAANAIPQAVADIPKIAARGLDQFNALGNQINQETNKQLPSLSQIPVVPPPNYEKKVSSLENPVLNKLQFQGIGKIGAFSQTATKYILDFVGVKKYLDAVGLTSKGPTFAKTVEEAVNAGDTGFLKRIISRVISPGAVHTATAGLVSDYLINPNIGNLSNLLTQSDSHILNNRITEYLKIRPGDSANTTGIKHAAEGLLTAGGITLLVDAIKATKAILFATHTIDPALVEQSLKEGKAVPQEALAKNPALVEKYKVVAAGNNTFKASVIPSEGAPEAAVAPPVQEATPQLPLPLEPSVTAPEKPLIEQGNTLVSSNTGPMTDAQLKDVVRVSGAQTPAEMLQALSPQLTSEDATKLVTPEVKQQFSRINENLTATKKALKPLKEIASEDLGTPIKKSYTGYPQEVPESIQQINRQIGAENTAKEHSLYVGKFEHGDLQDATLSTKNIPEDTPVGKSSKIRVPKGQRGSITPGVFAEGLARVGKTYSSIIESVTKKFGTDVPVVSDKGMEYLPAPFFAAYARPIAKLSNSLRILTQKANSLGTKYGIENFSFGIPRNIFSHGEEISIDPSIVKRKLEYQVNNVSRLVQSISRREVKITFARSGGDSAAVKKLSDENRLDLETLRLMNKPKNGPGADIVNLFPNQRGSINLGGFFSKNKKLEETPISPLEDAMNKAKAFVAPVNKLEEKIVKSTGPIITPKTISLTKPVLREEFTRNILNAVDEAKITPGTASRRLFLNVSEAIKLREIDPVAFDLDGLLSKYGLGPEEFAQELRQAATYSGKVLREYSMLAQRMKALYAVKAPEVIKMLDNTVNLEKTPNFVDWIATKWQRLENFRRAMLVTQWATGIRNAVSQAGMLTLGVVDEGLQATMKNVLFHSTEEHMHGLGIGLALANRLSKGGRAQLTHIMDSGGFQTMRLLQQPVHEIFTTGTMSGKIANGLNFINKAQENFFRKIAYEAKLRQLLKDVGTTLEDTPAASIPEEYHKIAVNYALERTFAQSAKGTFARELIDLWSKMPLATTVNPFPRFMFANALPFMFDHSPLGYLNALRFTKTGERMASILGGADFVKADKDAFIRTMSRATIGSAIFALAWHLRQSKFAGESALQIRLGIDPKTGEEKVVNLGAFTPLTSALQFADIIQRKIKGQNVFNMDMLNLVAGINRLGGTGLFFLDAFRDSNDQTTLQKFDRFIGEYAGSFTTGLKTFKDLASVANPSLGINPASKIHPFIAPTIRNIPGLNGGFNLEGQEVIPPMQPSHTPFTALPTHTIAPLWKQLGGITIQNVPVSEREFNRLGIKFSVLQPKTHNATADNLIMGYEGLFYDRAGDALLRSAGYEKLSDPAKVIFYKEIAHAAIRFGEGVLALTHPQLAAQARLSTAFSPDMRNLLKQGGVNIDTLIPTK